MAIYLLGYLTIVLSIYIVLIIKLKPILRSIIAVIFLIGSNVGILQMKIDFDKSQIIKSYNFKMNAHVGMPYERIMKHLNKLSKENQIDQLKQDINELDSTSSELFDVWRFSNDSIYTNKTNTIIQNANNK